MPMGGVKGGTNCRECIDCEPMMMCGDPMNNCFRCYGDGGGAPLKKDFGVGKLQPPLVAPNWCPHRK